MTTLAELKALREKATQGEWEGKYHSGAGFKLTGHMPRTDCAEFVLADHPKRTIAEAHDAVLMAYEPWIQFAPAAYKEMQAANFAFIAALVNWFDSGELQRLAELAEDGERWQQQQKSVENINRRQAEKAAARAQEEKS